MKGQIPLVCQFFTIPRNTRFMSFSTGRVSMRFLRQAALLVALISAPLAVQPATSAEGDPISVKVNMARILRIPTPAATVIIGNPGVADVSIQDPQTLVLTGKSYGQTNLIVLDEMGNPIADTMIEVIQAQADLMTVYQGAQRQTLVCSPVCQPMIMLGDDAGYTSGAVASKEVVAGAAQ
jgi:Flp pilus assembly secretin CpaC